MSSRSVDDDEDELLQADDLVEALRTGGFSIASPIFSELNLRTLLPC